jgi:hypothetical protein
MNDNIDNKYKNGKIYKIVDYTNGNIYIGSTIQELNDRLSCHKSNYKRHSEGKCRYVYSSDIIKDNDYKIELIENYNCNNRKELETRERWYIQNHICVNKVIPQRTSKEYYIDNRDKILEQQKQYDINNRDKQKKYKKQYNIKNRDKIQEQTKEYRIDNKKQIQEQTKEYRNKNRDKINEIAKQYYIKNKERISEKYKVKIKCQFCKREIRKGDISKHNKTKRHLNNIQK